MATVADDSSSTSEGRLNCPICLDVFISPRQLPCMHIFCEKCLQHLILTKVADNEGDVNDILCPVCRTVAKIHGHEIAIKERVLLFPRCTIPTTKESIMKLERYCDACKYENVSNVAESFCIACKEGLCDACTRFHRKTKATRAHRIISIEELSHSPEIQMQFAEGFACPEHQDKSIEFYCKSHEYPCCGECAYLQHKNCDQVINCSRIIEDHNPLSVIEEMKSYEKHLKTFLDVNESSVIKAETRVKQLIEEIRNTKKKINEKLDEIETMVQREGNRILKEEMIKRQEENHQCLCLLNAVRNSCLYLENVHKYGTDTQKFVIINKSNAHLKTYFDQINEKYLETESLSIHLELHDCLKNFVSYDISSIAKLESKAEKSHLAHLDTTGQCLKRREVTKPVVDTTYPGSKSPNTPLEDKLLKRGPEPLSATNKEFSPSKIIFSLRDKSNPCVNNTQREFKVLLNNVTNIKYSCPMDPSFKGVVPLPRERTILADSCNEICRLYDSTFQVLASYSLMAEPSDMCLVDEHEIALVYPSIKSIHFLLFNETSIVENGLIATKLHCSTLAAVNSKELVIAGPCVEPTKCYWSLITRDKEKLYREFEHKHSPFCRCCIALNNSKTRIYIGVEESSVIYCFSLNFGIKYFVYKSEELKIPTAIATDAEDNVYVLGFHSHNVHQLSPSGSILQVISKGVPRCPLRISFSKSGDMFLLTNQ
ncbi:hypothetical protein CHS0354_016472, partial [Potamilus streckersoni]